MHLIFSQIGGVAFTLLQLYTANVLAQTLELKLNLTSENFFAGDSGGLGFQMYSVIDLNYGNVLYQDFAHAKAAGLIQNTTDGHVIIKVDNTTSGAGDPTYGRASVNMNSTFPIGMGDLLVADLIHLPYGCSVWPGFYTLGANGVVWPAGGEIDLVEEVNNAAANQFSLHTTEGCTHPPASANVNETGQIVSTDCYNATAGNMGCIVQGPQNSFGAGFSAQGGGIFALYMSDSGISMWYIPRNETVVVSSESAVDLSQWPIPTAFYPNSTCQTSKYFTQQTVVLDIDICGAYAGAPTVFDQGGCTGTCTDLVANPANYDDAYFEFNYLAVFSSSNSSITQSSSSAASSGTAGTTTNTSSGALSSFVTSVLTIGLGIALPVVGAFITMAL